jgi:hypothetical protein
VLSRRRMASQPNPKEARLVGDNGIHSATSVASTLQPHVNSIVVVRSLGGNVQIAHLLPYAPSRLRAPRNPAEGADADKRPVPFRSAYKSEAGNVAVASAYFIGIGDAVAGIGWQRFFPDWVYDRHFTSDVQYARHLQSIDEGRKDFKRVPWGGAGPSSGLTGRASHSNSIRFGSQVTTPTFGRSYPRTSLGCPTSRSTGWWNSSPPGSPRPGRVIGDESVLRLCPSADGMMHDECMVGMGGTALHWSKAVRDVPDTAQLHKMVYERLAMSSVRNFTSLGAYRPAALRNHRKAKAFLESTSTGRGPYAGESAQNETQTF